MKRTKDITGEKFGKLTALAVSGKDKSGSVIWKCRCECGEIRNVFGKNLRGGTSKSCGCSSRDSVTTHNLTNTRLYRIWSGLKRRCLRPYDKYFKDYGGRGIEISDEWKEFINFYNWSVNSGYDQTLQIDRINNDGNYEPDNCRWVTVKENARNRRSNRYLTINGVTKKLFEWSEISGVSGGVISSRVKKGLQDDQLLKVVSAQ